MSDLIARLLSAGTPPELVAEVAMEIGRLRGIAEASGQPDAAAEKRRAWDRDRKRGEREAARLSTGSGGSPVDQVDNADTPPSFDKEPLSPTPPIQEIKSSPRATHPRDAREAFPRPDWAEPQVWADLLANRRRKGLANTATAHRKLLADIDRVADDSWPPGRILEAAVGKGWGAIYPAIKDDDEGGQRNGSRSGTERMGRHDRQGGSPSGMGRTVDALAEWVSGPQH